MIEKCFDSPSFEKDLRNSHYKMLQTILTLPEAKNCITFHTKTALNNLAGPELLEKLENEYPEILSKSEFELALEPSYRWTLYQRIFYMDIPYEAIHRIYEPNYFTIEEKQINSAILFSKIETFERIILNLLKNANNLESLRIIHLKGAFKGLKRHVFKFLRKTGIESALFILFNFYIKFEEKRIEYVNLAREGKSLEIEIKIHKTESEVYKSLKDINYSIENDFYLNVRKFLAKDHLNYFEKIFDKDVNKFKLFRNTKGAVYLLMNFLEGSERRIILLEKYELLNDYSKSGS
uniref:Uncharacterized protein n=1 Tax=Meloidogyne enterolobii TaxID=390850 RepID=A0A6V7WBP0_MELEN|nr:unnamed protein product [Meloidogyne enterolobii]